MSPQASARRCAARRQYATCRAAAIALQRTARGAAARRHVEQRWAALARLQRYATSSYMRLLVARLFAMAAAAEADRVFDILDARPSLLLVRSSEPGWRPTLLHAAAASGSLPLLQQLIDATAAALLDRRLLMQRVVSSYRPVLSPCPSS